MEIEFFLLNETGILSCSHISTTVWLHHLDFNEMLSDKVRLELCYDAACFFEQTLVAAPYKSVIVMPFALISQALLVK